jgi:hypothetical protein
VLMRHVLFKPGSAFASCWRFMSTLPTPDAEERRIPSRQALRSVGD